MQTQLSNEPFLLTGSSQACLFLHGLGGGIYQMRLLAEHLNQSGLTVNGINFPGHDQPVRQMPRSHWQDWFNHTLRAYQQLTTQYASVSVVGFSTGCLVGLHLAATYPVDKLVLLSPFMAIKHEWYYGFRPEIYLKTLGLAIENVWRKRLPIRDPEMLKLAEASIYFRTFNLPSVRSALELIEQVKHDLPQIDRPTLIIQSPKDTVVDPAGATLIYQTLNSQSKTLYWLKQSDHMIMMDRERDEVFTQVRQFLIG